MALCASCVCLCACTPSLSLSFSLQGLTGPNKLTDSTNTLALALPTRPPDSGTKDPDGLVKAIAVVAMYHGREEMERYVEECVRITQVRDGGCAVYIAFRELYIEWFMIWACYGV